MKTFLGCVWGVFLVLFTLWFFVTLVSVFAGEASPAAVAKLPVAGLIGAGIIAYYLFARPPVGEGK